MVGKLCDKKIWNEAKSEIKLNLISILVVFLVVILKGSCLFFVPVLS